MRDSLRWLGSFCLLFCFSACLRQLDRVVVQQEGERVPTFLASGSGVYSVARVRTPFGLQPSSDLSSALFNAVEIGDNLVLATVSRSAAFGDDGLLSFVVPLDRSGAHAIGSVDLADTSGDEPVTLRFSVRMGFDTLSLGVIYTDGAGLPDFCRELPPGSECLSFELEPLRFRCAPFGCLHGADRALGAKRCVHRSAAARGRRGRGQRHRRRAAHGHRRDGDQLRRHRLLCAVRRRPRDEHMVTLRTNWH